MAKLSDFDGCFFGPEGQPLTALEWLAEFSNTNKFCRRTTSGVHTIITKWTGVDCPSFDELHTYGFTFGKWAPNETPLIFESYVLDAESEVLKHVQYPTRTEAYVGHQALVASFTNS